MNGDSSNNSQDKHSWFDKISQVFSDEPKNREDLLEYLREAGKQQIINKEVLDIIEGAIKVSDMQVRSVMIPRSQMVVIRINQSPEEFLPQVVNSSHSRFPVIGEAPDDVLGMLLAKDLLPYALNSGLDNFNMTDVLRKATFVPESKRLNILLNDFRTNRQHMAIVLDEYSGIAGLVTIEDVLEQIVGDIEDEYDTEENDDDIKSVQDNFIVKALTSIEDFNNYFQTSFADDEFGTIGGIVTQKFGYLPNKDEQIIIDQFDFKVLSADRRRIRLLQVTPLS